MLVHDVLLEAGKQQVLEVEVEVERCLSTWSSRAA